MSDRSSGSRTPPAFIGGYRVMGELGRGAMGAVYRAQHGSGVEVAIKVLSAGQDASDNQRRRFGREARALSQLSHPHVVRLLDLGTHEGAPYLVMEFHTGGSLQDEISRQLLDQRHAAQCGAQLAEGLAAAHAQGLLHRDLKPDNVLVAADGRVVLTDFGLAKDLDRAGKTQRLTETGAFMGTPGYWAPEQAAGRPEAVGPWADIYGLGATIYAALTGRAPIVGSNLIEIATATADEPPPPIRSLRPEIAPDLAAIVMRCLEKEPAARWPSADAVAEALRAHLAKAPDSRGSPRGLLAAGVVLLVAGVAVGGAVALSHTAKSSPSPRAAGHASGPSPAGTGREEVDGESLYKRTLEALRAKRFEEALRLAQLAAEAGHPRSMEQLAYLLSADEGVPPDLPRAAHWYGRAAEAGRAVALRNLGLMHRDGLGLPQNPAKAAELFRRAALQRYTPAMHDLGKMLVEGAGVPKDETKGTEWFRGAAEEGDVLAMLGVAESYQLGRGVAKDMARALHWLRRAAGRGNHVAMHSLGVLLSESRDVPRNEPEAARWFRTAAEGGYPRAMSSLANLLELGAGVPQDLPQALRWYRSAAKLGDPAAMGALGRRYHYGRGVAQDYKQAYVWYERAAKRGSAGGMRGLGTLFLSGQGVAQDDTRAAELFRQAADKGDMGATANMGYMHESGRGVKQDLSESARYYRLAAERGSTPAMTSLGRMFSQGRGVKPDAREAVRWFMRAANAGQTRAAFWLADAYDRGLGVARDVEQAQRWYRAALESSNAPTRAEAAKRLRRLESGG